MELYKIHDYNDLIALKNYYGSIVYTLYNFDSCNLEKYKKLDWEKYKNFPFTKIVIFAENRYAELLDVDIEEFITVIQNFLV